MNQRDQKRVQLHTQLLQLPVLVLQHCWVVQALGRLVKDGETDGALCLSPIKWITAVTY